MIVPFAGPAGGLERTLRALAALRTSPADEVIVVDDRLRAPVASADQPRAGPGADPMPRLIPGGPARGPAAARNTAARLAGGEWLVFLDADVVPDADLLDRYLRPDPAPGVGVMAGGLVDVASGPGLAGRWAVARGKMGESQALRAVPRPYAQTANCAVRAAAFWEVGGFEETGRAGEDADLCWRLAAAGWALEHRPEARARHLARLSLTGLLGQLATHGAGMAWLGRRHAGAFPAPGLGELLARVPRHLLSAARAPASERSLILVDLLAEFARDLGRLRANRPPRSAPR